MAIKIFDIPSVGSIKVSKRRGTRNLRIRLSANGDIIVSQPSWLPYSAGTEFARNNREWIEKHRSEPTLFTQDMPIGKSHRLIFVRTQSLKPSVRLKGKYATVLVPTNMSIKDDDIQAAAKRIARKALTAESEYLGSRLAELAEKYNFTYQDLNFKFMKSKWGSRRSDGRITLNYRLLDLHDDHITYVLCHELAHVKHMNHSPEFWSLVQSMVPDYKQHRKAIKSVKLTW